MRIRRNIGGSRHGDASLATAAAPSTEHKRSQPGHAAITLPGYVQSASHADSRVSVGGGAQSTITRNGLRLG